MRNGIIFLLLLIFNFQVQAIPVTYAITVSNESEELKRLLKQVSSNLDEEDKILIQVDKDNHSKAVLQVINNFGNKVASNQYKVIYFPLNNNFAAFKNNLLANAGKKGFMLQLDADEVLSFSLMQNFKYFLAQNEDADLIKIPRANYHINMEESLEFQQMDKNLSDELGRFRYPDLQSRLMRLDNKKLRYNGALHESLLGVKKIVIMPHSGNNQNWDLIHIKTMKKQRIADKLYKQIEEIIK